MNNKRLGTAFEREFCELLAARGFWVHFMSPSASGAQPCDIIACRNNTPYLFDCKTCEKDTFLISRLEVVGKVGKKKTDLVKFRIAYDFVVSETSGNKIKQFITCCCYGKLANYAQHLANSDIVLVTGKLREDTYHDAKHPEDKFYIMVTTLFLQPLVFESPEKYRKRVRARRQGYVVEEEASGEEYLSREKINDDMATPGIQDEDLPF